MAELLKGKPVVDSMALDLRARIEALGRAKVVPALALVRVGQRPDDLSYERTARKRAESLASPSGRTSWTSSPPKRP